MTEINESFTSRWTRRLRLLYQFIRHGFSDENKYHLNLALRIRYHRLPSSLKKIPRYFYHQYMIKKQPPHTSPVLQISSESSHGSAGFLPKLAAFDVICFANIDWNARFQRPQQMMTQFALNDHRVFYIVLSRVPPQGEFYSATEVAPNIFEIALPRPQTKDPYSEVINDADIQTCIEGVGALSRDFGIKTAIQIVHITYWTALVFKLRQAYSWRIQYDCMDDWAGFPNIGNALLEEEDRLVADADLVTVTAALLKQKWAGKGRDCLLIRNGVDFDFFYHNYAPNKLLENISRPIIGFYGALAEWVDFELIATIADRRPDWNFVLIGDVFVNDLAGLEQKRNVHLLGRKPYLEMPLYLYHFDVCMIPFRLYNVTHAVDPVKFYEFISAGKPVVSVPLEEMNTYGQYVYFADGKDAFITQIELALAENDNKLVNHRVALAQANDWKARFESNRDAILQLYSKVSIIIITYNNIEITKGCLDSIFANTAYPNYELIIIDNASTDDTRNYLRYLSRIHQNVNVILNNSNLGFAAANNQGLKAADGSYLVLLNNDTVVTKGWIDTFIKHLEDPQVGMLGPVTNSVGNEAKISTDYKNFEEMARFAERYTEQHRGEVFDISMLAMFCVAMRRDVFERVGLLDEAFGIGMFEDDDYSRRIKAVGLKTVCIMDVFIHHYGQASFKKLQISGEYQKIWDKNKAYFESKWGAWQPHKHRVPANDQSAFSD